MSIDQAKLLINQNTDLKQLQELKEHITRRIKELHKLNWERKIHERVQMLLALPIGTELWCNASGWFMAGNVQRGTKLILTHKFPKGKRYKLAVRREGDTVSYKWDSDTFLSYNILPQDPKVSDAEKKHSAEVGAIFAEATRNLR